MEIMLDAFVFMKVGNHAGETFEQILERKNRELQQAGCIFWGYGGSACHPITQVQPFTRLHVKKYGSVYLLMEPVDSRADPEILPAKEYSEDGVRWRPIPDGILVTGSKFALVLDEIKPEDLELRPQELMVDIGPSRGKTAEEYLRGRIDKACLVRKPEPIPASPEQTRRSVKYSAKLLEPYAVMLR
jgi:hypothetical protein